MPSCRKTAGSPISSSSNVICSKVSLSMKVYCGPISDRIALVALDRDLHALLQEDRRLADQLLVDRDLLEGLVVHESVLRPVLVEELVLLLVELDPLDDVCRADAFVQLGAVADVLELDLQIGAPVAHLHDVNLGCTHQAALILEDVAGAHFVAVDLHGKSRLEKRRAS